MSSCGADTSPFEVIFSFSILFIVHSIVCCIFTVTLTSGRY